MSEQARLFVDSRDGTGEGPFWHHLRQQLFWFDIPGSVLYAANQDGTVANTWRFERMASAAGIVDRDNLVIAEAGQIFRFNLETGARSKLVDLDADVPGNRSNDGRVNPAGGLWIGTMANSERAYSGSLYQYRNGALKKLGADILCPNSTCFSPDGKIAYFTDTPNKIIMKRPIDPATGEPTGFWSVFANTSSEPGSPDGSVVDAEGYLWNARWGGSRVIRYSPAGKVDREVMLPVSQVTCPAFGGPDLKTLYITSARKELDAAALEREPHAGGVFVCEPGIAGLQETIIRA